MNLTHSFEVVRVSSTAKSATPKLAKNPKVAFSPKPAF